MAKQRSSQISLTTLILCLCLGSLAILPVINVVGTPALEIFGAVTESNPLDQAELDDEFAIVAIAGMTFSGLIFLKTRTTNLDFLAIRLLPDSPPPKHA